MSPKDKFEVGSSTLTFRFDSPEAAEHFKSWLCESGEQSYWDWMRERETEEEGDITGISFGYFKGPDVPVKCGRLDAGWEKTE